jgi:hypothetical protein
LLSDRDELDSKRSEKLLSRRGERLLVVVRNYDGIAQQDGFSKRL